MQLGAQLGAPLGAQLGAPPKPKTAEERSGAGPKLGCWAGMAIYGNSSFSIVLGGTRGSCSPCPLEGIFPGLSRLPDTQKC